MSLLALAGALTATAAAQDITEIIDAAGDGVHALSSARGVAVDAAGNVYVQGLGSNNVFKIEPGGAITELIDFTGDGLGHFLSAPAEVAVDLSGNVFVTGQASDNVFRIAPSGAITQIADATGDGVSTLDGVADIAVSAGGRAYVTGGNSDNAFEIEPPCGLFADLGNGLAGTAGIPRLEGAGPLCGGTKISVSLSDAAANADATLVIGLSTLDAPFKGGVLVPDPDILIFGLTTDGLGGLVLFGTWPAGLPSGLEMFLQYWIVDAAGPVGFSASNAISVELL